MASRRDDRATVCCVRIHFGRDAQSAICCDVSDESSIPTGDYSPERLATFQAEVARKIEKAWGYMRDRSIVPECELAGVE